MSDAAMQEIVDPDGSLNIVSSRDGRVLNETRVVYREDPEVGRYPVVYLSTQRGCRQACRMCWLTQTGQTDEGLILNSEIEEQAMAAVERIWHGRYDRLHFAFMARGEPLAQQRDWLGLLTALRGVVWSYMGETMANRTRFLVSTIMPSNVSDLVETFPHVHPEIYWSLYSVDPEVRRRWLPKAHNPETAAAMLRQWQRHTSKEVKVHHALIPGVNDRPEDAAAIVELLRRHRLRCSANLVAYNPHDGTPESPDAASKRDRYAAVLWAAADVFSRVDTVARVGVVAHASCGMFVGGKTMGPFVRPTCPPDFTAITHHIRPCRPYHRLEVGPARNPALWADMVAHLLRSMDLEGSTADVVRSALDDAWTTATHEIQSAFIGRGTGAVVAIGLREETDAVMAHERAGQFAVAAAHRPGSDAVTILLGDLRAVRVPLSMFEPVPGVVPDFNDIGIEDHGQTLRLGRYEASVDALLGEVEW